MDDRKDKDWGHNYHASSACDELDGIVGNIEALRDVLVDMAQSRRFDIDEETLKMFAQMEEAMTERLHDQWEAAWDAIINAPEKELREVDIPNDRDMPKFFWRASESRQITVAEYRLLEKKLADNRRIRNRVPTNPATLIATGQEE